MTLAKKVILKDSEGNYLIPFVDTSEIETKIDSKAEDESVVKKSGDIMSGRLIIASDIKDGLRLTNTTKNAGLNLASEVEDVVRIDFYDATTRVGDCGVINNSATNTGDYFRLRVFNHTSQKWVGIYLYNLDDGSSYATCPTPSSSTDSSTKIATTAWVQKLLSGSGIYVTTYKNGTTWYREYFSNASKTTRVWIEQGGRTGKGDASVTYPKAFSNTNYMLQISPLTTDNSNDNCNVNSISTTGFTARVESNNSGFWFACGV